MKYAELPRNKENKIIAENLTFPIEIPLLAPLPPPSDGERAVMSVNMREPTLDDMEIVSNVKGLIPGTRRLIALATGVDEDTLKDLKARDYKRINEVLDSFL